MGSIERSLRAISPVLAVLMMIAVAIAGSLVVYAWVMGYIGFSTERAGEAIKILSVANDPTDADLLVYVQNVGEGVAQLEEDDCLYVNGIPVSCTISDVTVSDGLATLNDGETATLRYVGGAALPGEKVSIKVTTLRGTSAEKSAYPAGTVGLPPGTMLWNRTYGGPETEQAFSMVRTFDGGYILAGITVSVETSEDVWLVKADASGTMEWNRTYGGPELDGAYSLVATSDGGCAFAGYTYSFGAGDADFWLVKMDASGNVEWNRTYGGTNSEVACSLVATSDGGYAIAGYTRTVDVDLDYDFWLVKTDELGNMEWNQTYEGTGYDYARSLVATSDGGYAIAGYTQSFGLGDAAFWLIKADASGNMEWNKTYGGTSYDLAFSVVKCSDGGYAIAGETASFGAGSNDFWLIKTDELGNMEWNQTYGGTGTDRARSLVETSDRGYAIAGYTLSFGAGGYDGWLVKTDASGTVEWSQTYGGTADDLVHSLVETSNGGYAIAGITESFGNEYSDFWLIKTN
jgi:FlaG/FlaF family flagellin (archaellin)